MLTRTLALALSLLSANTYALSFNEALSLAEQNAPEIAARRAADEAATEMSNAAGLLPNPKLSLGIDDVQLSGDSRFDLSKSKRSIGVMQEFPSASKRLAERQMAQAEQAANQRQSLATRLSVRQEVANAWLSLYFVAKKIDQLQAQQQENQLMQTKAKASLAATGGANEALSAQLEGLMLADELDALHAEQQQAQAQLARWIGPKAAEQSVTGSLPAFVMQLAKADGLQTQPEMQMAQAQLTSSQAQLALANAQKDVDWGVELGYARGTMGDNMGMLKVSIDMPWFSSGRIAPQERAALANIARSQAEVAVRQASLQQNYTTLSAEYRALQSQLQRQATQVLPLLEQQVALAVANYRAGSASADQVLSARTQKLKSQLRQIELQSQLASKATQIHFLTGEQ
ncbi:TolC family protein [Chitinibacter sp. GC72]|uniref:TolC family protein n=1 Tax=Chitinibacter sp. GC72 TaxID=1526917 RepID=UPI0012FAA72E|nr:TolC family protein [Chitinibacter sp. GC72]